jgi:hypothetical protein
MGLRWGRLMLRIVGELGWVAEIFSILLIVVVPQLYVLSKLINP